MAMHRRSLLLAVAAVWGGYRVPLPAQAQDIAIIHARVIPMDVERVLDDQTVIIANGRIVAMGPASAVTVPGGALRVNAGGRYLLPALCDMHVHLLSEAWNMMLPPEARSAGRDLPFQGFLLPYVANGVTTVQVLAATAEDIRLRGRIARGEVLGPRLVLARLIDGPKKAWPPPLSVWVATAAEARAAVLQAKAEGYDKIKVYSFLSREAYDAIIAAAREVGMDVIGHVPMSLSVESVLDAGQKLIAHSEEVEKHTGGDYRAERIDYFAAKLAERGVWMIPTLVTTRTILGFFAHPDSLLAGPEAAYFRHPLQTGVWSFLTANLYAPVPGPARIRLSEGFERFQRPLTRAFHDKGGKLLAGSDAMMIGLFPGFALHRELEELVGAGLTPYQALRTATTNPFEYLGESDRAGTIAVGKYSDLLLVDGNPLDDVSAAAKVAGVLIQGRWLGREEIGARMRQVAGASRGAGESHAP
jgi:imidazolonepropionase-like amidohydrolase